MRSWLSVVQHKLNSCSDTSINFLIYMLCAWTCNYNIFRIVCFCCLLRLVSIHVPLAAAFGRVAFKLRIKHVPSFQNLFTFRKVPRLHGMLPKHLKLTGFRAFIRIIGIFKYIYPLNNSLVVTFVSEQIHVEYEINPCDCMMYRQRLIHIEKFQNTIVLD